jgi:chromosomal replication initiation ATPase DnaA
MELETNYLLAYAKCRQKVAYLERHLETLIQKHEREITELKGELINPLIDWKKPQPRNMSRLCKAVCRVCDITPGQLVSPQRRRNYVIGRQLFFYVGRYEMKIQWSKLAGFLCKDHSTGIHGADQFENYLKLGYKHETQLYYDVLAELADEVDVIEELELAEIEEVTNDKQ